MNHDLSHTLREWEYDPSTITARWVEGDDGARRVQLRLDLGIFQMELDGRPDGTTPRGYPSLLDYYLILERTSTPGSSALDLDETACMELQQEAVQYYYRYLCFYSLNELDRVIEDTRHNLHILDLVSRRAPDEDLVWQFLQFYPEVRTMHTRALAEKEANRQCFDAALEVIEEGLSDVRAFWKEHGEIEEDDEGSHEEDVLFSLMQEIQERRPITRADRLRAALERAISSENYEKAARLRDELKKAEQKPVKGALHTKA